MGRVIRTSTNKKKTLKKTSAMAEIPPQFARNKTNSHAHRTYTTRHDHVDHVHTIVCCETYTHTLHVHGISTRAHVNGSVSDVALAVLLCRAHAKFNDYGTIRTFRVRAPALMEFRVSNDGAASPSYNSNIHGKSTSSCVCVCLVLWQFLMSF